MNATKQKILVKSLVLFNDQGISSVSLRTIADEAGISVGNLQYHFKKREDIVEALYFQLVDKMNNVFTLDEKEILRSFFLAAKEIISVMYAYQFFLLDFVTVVRNNQRIKKHYAELSKQREHQFLMIVDVLISEGLFRKEFIENEYKTLFKRTEVLSNFWFSSVLIQAAKLPSKTIEAYSLIASQSIYPYLTEKGRKEYAELFPEQLL